MSRPQGWSSLRNSRLHHVGADRRLAGNAPFPPVAEMLTSQPCQWVAEKVSLVPFACSVLEAVGQSRHTLHANGTPGKRRGAGAQQLMTVDHCKWNDRGVIVEFSTLLRGPGPWPTPPAGTATAAPTPALTVVRAPPESWPAPSSPTSVAGARSFLRDKAYFHGDQSRPSCCSVSLGSRGFSILRNRTTAASGWPNR